MTDIEFDENFYQEILKRFKKIKKEIELFQGSLKNDIKKAFGTWGFFYTLPSNTTHSAGKVYIGLKAETAFRKIVEYVLNNNPKLKNKTSDHVLQVCIKDAFWHSIIHKREELSLDTTQKIIHTAINTLKSKHLNTATYYIPCILPLDKKCKEFSIYPVKFTQVEIFLKTNKKALHEYSLQIEKSELKKSKNISEKEKKEIKKYAHSYERSLKSHYKNYTWLASIEINNTEKERAQDISQLAIKTALNFLQLITSKQTANRIFLPDRGCYLEKETAELTRLENGAFNITSVNNLNFDSHNGWVNSTDLRWLAFGENLLANLLQETTDNLPYRRYLNALWWYGEAMNRSTLPFMKIISLSNALEAFLVTDRTDATQQISSRATCFLKERDSEKNWEPKVKKFYKLRSDLVHGHLSPFDRKVNKEIATAIEIVRGTLICGAPWTEYLVSEECQTTTAIAEKFTEYLNGEINRTCG